MNGQQTLKSRYRDRLNRMPPPGQRHTALLGIANLGIMAGAGPERIHEDIRRVAADMPDKEIMEAINKAASDHGEGGSYRPPPRPAPLVKNGKTALQRIILQGTVADDADLWECSPIKLNDSPESDPLIFISVLFQSSDLIFIGDRLEPGILGRNIRTAADWISFFQAGGKAGPFIIINPLSGEPAPKKTGDGDSLRGDANVREFRHCLVEFDNLSFRDQIKFWSAAKLPIVALIHSGGKSIHAWLDVPKFFNVSAADDWDREIKRGLYEKALVPLGVDRACSNPSRLSRLPGHFRNEKSKFQRLLWLSPEGREVAR